MIGTLIAALIVAAIIIGIVGRFMSLASRAYQPRRGNLDDQCMLYAAQRSARWQEKHLPEPPPETEPAEGDGMPDTPSGVRQQLTELRDAGSISPEEYRELCDELLGGQL